MDRIRFLFCSEHGLVELVAPRFARAQGNGLVPLSKREEALFLKPEHFFVEITQSAT
jgi:hypothetical protein